MMYKDTRCPRFHLGYCIFKDECKFFHPAKVCTHIDGGYCQICDPYSDDICIYYQDGNCKYGEKCKFLHTRRDLEFRRFRQKYGDITTLPADILKIIFSDLYLSDLISVCKYVNQIIYEHYPLKLFIFKDIYIYRSETITKAMAMSRNKNDAIFLLSLRAFNNYATEPTCKTINDGYTVEIPIKSNEWKNELFYYFRIKLIKSLIYKRKKGYTEFKTMEINSADMFLRLSDLTPEIFPLCNIAWYH